MPIVNVKSTLYHDPTGIALEPDPLLKAGRLICATGQVANGASDSNGSVYELIDLPADCILHPLTYFDVTAVDLAAVRIGTRDDVDALVSVNQSAGNIVSPIGNGDANHNKRLWEVLGLASDPGGFITLCQHAIADAGGAGTLQFQILYIYH